MPQLKILSALERESFESPPIFNNVGRKKYFTIPSGLLPAFESLRTPTNKAWLILMYGYFKAAKRFFGSAINEKDLGFVAKQLRVQPCEISQEQLSDTNYRRLKNTIFNHFGCTEFDEMKTFLVPFSHQP